MASAVHHRIDAARRLLTVPGCRMEASGRLFFAKRVHQALKAGDADLDQILDEVVAALPEGAREGARREHEVIRGILGEG